VGLQRRLAFDSLKILEYWNVRGRKGQKGYESRRDDRKAESPQLTNRHDLVKKKKKKKKKDRKVGVQTYRSQADDDDIKVRGAANR
jgi:hypothetical protein